MPGADFMRIEIDRMRLLPDKFARLGVKGQRSLGAGLAIRDDYASPRDDRRRPAGSERSSPKRARRIFGPSLGQLRFAGDALAADTPELFFTPELDGYGWCFRKGPVLNIGLGREAGGKLGESVAAFTDWLKRQGKIPADIPQRFHGHAYLLFPQRSPRRVSGDGVLLIGDAAGLAYPQSGEGIRPAVESALLAAEVIAQARGDYREAHLAPYVVRLNDRFGERATEPATMPWLPLGMKRFLASQLLGNRLFTRRVVLDRWFLHRQQAPLAAVG